MLRAPDRFVNETLWPHFERSSAELRRHLDEVEPGFLSLTQRLECLNNPDVIAIRIDEADLPRADYIVHSGARRLALRACAHGTTYVASPKNGR
mgnify:CR=1 FL=1